MMNVRSMSTSNIKAGGSWLRDLKEEAVVGVLGGGEAVRKQDKGSENGL